MCEKTFLVVLGFFHSFFFQTIHLIFNHDSVVCLYSKIRCGQNEFENVLLHESVVRVIYSIVSSCNQASKLIIVNPFDAKAFLNIFSAINIP